MCRASLLFAFLVAVLLVLVQQPLLSKAQVPSCSTLTFFSYTHTLLGFRDPISGVAFSFNLTLGTSFSSGTSPNSTNAVYLVKSVTGSVYRNDTNSTSSLSLSAVNVYGSNDNNFLPYSSEHMDGAGITVVDSVARHYNLYYGSSAGSQYGLDYQSTTDPSGSGTDGVGLAAPVVGLLIVPVCHHSSSTAISSSSVLQAASSSLLVSSSSSSTASSIMPSSSSSSSSTAQPSSSIASPSQSSSTSPTIATSSTPPQSSSSASVSSSGGSGIISGSTGGPIVAANAASSLSCTSFMATVILALLHWHLLSRSWGKIEDVNTARKATDFSVCNLCPLMTVANKPFDTPREWSVTRSDW